GHPRARRASRADRLSLHARRRVPDGGMGVRGRADAALGRGPVLPAARSARLFVAAASHAAGASERATFLQSARVGRDRPSACGTLVKGVPGSDGGQGVSAFVPSARLTAIWLTLAVA